jgi:hypothetical protein
VRSPTRSAPTAPAKKTSPEERGGDLDERGNRHSGGLEGGEILEVELEGLLAERLDEAQRHEQDRGARQQGSGVRPKRGEDAPVQGHWTRLSAQAEPG